MPIAKPSSARARAFASVLAGATLAQLAPAAAEVYAVTVGINTYDVEQSLEGAVADARDIYDSLRAFGAKDVVLLLNEEADREAIRGAWRRMAAQVGPGDTFVFHYSGHGGREPDANGDERTDAFPEERTPDTLDETLILSGFSPANPGDLRWRIIDDEIQEWTREITDRGAAVLVVADSCFSGTLTRGGGRGRSIGMYGDPQNAAPRTRGWGTAPEPAPAPPAPAAGPASVYLLSAAEEISPVNEIRIGDTPRGALSYAFARALENADANQDGALARSELEPFVIASAQHVDGGSEGPELSPPARPGEDPVILQRGRVAPPIEPPAPEQEADAAPARDGPDHRARLKVVAGSWDDLPSTINSVARPDQTAPDLIYNARTGRLGDHEDVAVAQRLDASALQNAAAKYMLLSRARDFGAQPPLGGSLEPSAQIYQDGERVTARFGPLMRPYLTIVNLASDGSVQSVFPHIRRPRQSAAQRLYRDTPIRLRVGPPFGADHLFAISTNAPPSALRRRIRRGLSAAELADWVEGPGRDINASYGVIAFYSEDAQ